MGKTKCTVLAAELGVEPKELLLRAKAVLTEGQMTGGTTPHFTYFTEKGCDTLRQHDAAPMTVAKRYNARGLHPAQNPRWVFAKINGIEGKHPVAIPVKLQGKLVGKPFCVEAIEDINGVTFRHEALSRK